MSQTTTAHGSHVNAEPLTTSIIAAAAPDLLRSHIDERITRIRPASTPLDQISRSVGARHAGSMKVDFYSVDTKPASTKVKATVSVNKLVKGTAVEFEVTDANVISPSETVLLSNISITDGGKKHTAVLYVTEVNGTSVKALPVIEDDNVTLAQIPAQTKVIRMGRGAGELDVQTSQYTAIPRKDYNYCQIFKAQVEESLISRLADKEVGWTFSDQEESAIIDMKLGMEKSYLLGNRSRLELPDGNQIMLTGGIWHQAGKEFGYSKGDLNEENLDKLMRKAFTGGCGSTKKVLLAGSGLISELSKQQKNRVVTDTQKKVVWGIDFDIITSKYGTLYVKLSEIFDLCGMENYGMVIDPDFITKYSHIPFQAERISFHKQGLRNTEGIVLTEASCLVLRYPDAHMRIVVE